LHKLPGELRKVIYKLALDHYLAYDPGNRREIIYWVHSLKKRESVVLKRTALKFVPGLEAACVPSQPDTVMKSPENAVIGYLMLIRALGFDN
jgi:hypothetical protein